MIDTFRLHISTISIYFHNILFAFSIFLNLTLLQVSMDKHAVETNLKKIRRDSANSSFGFGLAKGELPGCSL